MSRGTATCPVADCEYNDTPSQVAAHVDGTMDSDHDWSMLPYDGPDEFLQTSGTDEEADLGPAPTVGDEASEPARVSEASSTTEQDEESRLERTNEGSDKAAADTTAKEEPAETRAEKEPTEPTETTADEESAEMTPDEESSAPSPGDDSDILSDYDSTLLPDDGSDLLPDDDLRRGVRATFTLLDRLEADSVEELALDELVNLFTVFSLLSSAAGNARSEIREEIIERIDGNVELAAEFGTISHTVETSRSLRDEETVRERLRDAGIDLDDVQALDPDLVADAIDVAGVDESDVFDLEERESVRRAAIDEDALAEFDEEE